MAQQSFILPLKFLFRISFKQKFGSNCVRNVVAAVCNLLCYSPVYLYCVSHLYISTVCRTCVSLLCVAMMEEQLRFTGTVAPIFI